VGVVNVAGFCMVSPLELTARADVTRMIDLDLMAYLDVIRAFFPLLRGNRGRVVNIGSVGGYAAVPGWTVYSGVKAAVENLTRAWAMETVQLGIRMTTVRPGIVASGAIGPKIQHAIDGRRRDEKAVGYDSLGDVLLPEEGANPAGKAAYQPLMERNAQNLELAKVGGTPAINVAKTVRDALVSSTAKMAVMVLTAALKDGALDATRLHSGGGRAVRADDQRFCPRPHLRVDGYQRNGLKFLGLKVVYYSNMQNLCNT
jgi:NAD(P)-dependent dehydrogenase (short-subunit alcohol dehydrogenase family)